MLNYVIIGKNIKEFITSQDLSAGALSYTTTIGKPFRILQVLGTNSAGITETLTVKLDSRNGTNYDHKLGEIDFDGNQDVALLGGYNLLPIVAIPTDELIITTSGSASSGTLYITGKYEELQ